LNNNNNDNDKEIKKLLEIEEYELNEEGYVYNTIHGIYVECKPNIKKLLEEYFKKDTNVTLGNVTLFFKVEMLRNEFTINMDKKTLSKMSRLEILMDTILIHYKSEEDKPLKDLLKKIKHIHIP